MKLWEKSKKCWENNRQEFFYLFASTAVLLLLPVLFGYPIVNLDNSIKGKIFWTEKKTYPLKEGDIIVFKFKGSRYFPKGARFIKTVACLPGQTLTTSGRCFRCSGKLLGCAKTKDRQGNPAPLFVWNGKIPDNKYFVMGTNPDSYDSRYWGFVDRKQIICRAKRIL